MWPLMIVSPVVVQVFSKMFGCARPIFLDYLLLLSHIEKRKERDGFECVQCCDVPMSANYLLFFLVHVCHWCL